MRGAYLPGDRRVEMREVLRPHPGPGQVLVEMRASGICGSDLRAIYREHLGTGPETYREVIAGHEPCGVIVAVTDRFPLTRVGDAYAAADEAVGGKIVVVMGLVRWSASPRPVLTRRSSATGDGRRVVAFDWHDAVAR